MTTPTAIEVDVSAAAQAVLDLAAAALDTSAPARQYRSAGPAPWDFVSNTCDSQLTVWVGPEIPGAAGFGAPGRAETSPNRLRSYTFTVELVRKSAMLGAQGQAPTAAALDAIGARHMEDFQTLDLWVRSLGFSSKRVPDSLTAVGVKQVAAGQLATVPPSGGLVGLRAQFVLVI